MEVEFISDMLKKVDFLTKSPENYLCLQEEKAEEIKKLVKKLYDFNKVKEKSIKHNSDILDELIIEDLDEEQIWQQIELQNNFICQELIVDIAELLTQKNILLQEVETDKDNQCKDLNFKTCDDDASENENESKLLSSQDEEEFTDKNLGSESEVEEDKQEKEPLNENEKSVVDDRFFKLKEMEEFLIKEENYINKDSEDEENDFDYFQNFKSDSDNENDNFYYDDFFDQPHDISKEKKRKRENIIEKDSHVTNKKKVKFSLDKVQSKNKNSDVDSDNDNDSDDNDDDDEDDDDISFKFNQGKEKRNDGTISTFEARQERLNAKIKALEDEALAEKPWQLKGEITATNRPYNSLLEEYVEFDTAVRPPPVITEKSTLKLEDIIKQRIKDKAWDDVERKIKPVENPTEYKKRLVLDQEKSKLSLAEIYEREYLKQKEDKNGNLEDKPEEVPQEHLEIEKLMKELFSKLDALSNFHFTPKMVSTEVKVISNLPAITVEEVAPEATSDGALLAPEEINPKTKGDLIGKSERTKTDKKRERRLKKKRQKLKRMAAEKKSISKTERAQDSNKKNKKIQNKTIKKLGNNVMQLNENSDRKYIKNSNTFFTKLQDEIKIQIRNKSQDSNKFQKEKKFDIKKLKL